MSTEDRSKPVEIPIEAEDELVEESEAEEQVRPRESTEGQPEPEEPVEAAEAETEAAEAPAKPAEEDERLLRLMAEFANFRRRVAAEKEQLESDAKARLVKGLLGVLDAFQQMLQDQEEQRDADALLEGARLIYKQLWENLAAEGLQRIEALDSAFNPMEHEAVMTQPVSDPKLDGVVISVLQEGYRFRDKLLRPSQVVVGQYEDSVDGRSA